MAYSMDELVFVSSWSPIVGAKLQIKVDLKNVCTTEVE